MDSKILRLRMSLFFLLLIGFVLKVIDFYTFVILKHKLFFVYVELGTKRLNSTFSTESNLENYLSLRL